MRPQASSVANLVTKADPVTNLTGTVEAILFVGGMPVIPAELAKVLADVECDQIVQAVAELNQRYFRQRRPYEIRRIGAGYQMQLRPQYAPIARRVRGGARQVRLSQAAIEVLSLIAYKQPISAPEVDAIRGTPSGAILRQLRRRNLIDTVEATEEGRRVVRYRTTQRFCDVFHLGSLEELPRVQELERP